MTRQDYYAECLSQAFDEAGIVATAEQIRLCAEHVEGAAENVGMAFYQPESPVLREVSDLKAALKRETSKVVCPECMGRGTYHHQGPYHSASGFCFKCRGEGKVIP